MKKIISIVLALTVAFSVMTFAPLTAAAAGVPTLTVDMTDRTGPMRHGSAGFLYGLGSHGTPNPNTLTPLKPGTAVQKAPDGLQHPTGDVLDVAETFLEAGGEQVQIYLQDIFALWSYEYTTIDDYLNRIKEMVPKIVELRESRPDFEGKFVYVPYNEPDGIWFNNVNNDTGVQDRFNEYWQKAYTLIKELDPEALIGGASYATYQGNAMRSWINFCAANDCEPDYITWHELQTDKLNSFKSHLDDYRAIEKAAGMTEREIIINEYAPQADCSVPGKLVNWIALFEENKVSGCLPYWHMAGNLNDIAADNNEPNGAWWLYKWYGDMSGETLKLTTSTAREQLYGLASIDDNKKSANVIFGGVDGTADVVLENVADTDAFKDAKAVNIKIEATYWTAFHGVAAEPTIIRTGTYAVEDGRVVVELDGMEASAAYNITITAADEDDEPGAVFHGPWRKTWEAETAEYVGGVFKSNDPTTYAYSGGYRLSGLNTPDDGVDIKVDVPVDGYYRADMVYGNGYGVNTADPAAHDPKTVYQTRSVDSGESVRLTLENTLGWKMGGMYIDYIELSAGEHTISYRGTDDTPQGASIDCLSLTYVGGEIPEFDSLYEAELGDFNTLLDNSATTVTTENTLGGYSASGYITGLDGVSVENGGGVRFTVVVPDNGMYSLTLRYAAEADAKANIYLDNTALTLNNLLTTVDLPASESFTSSGVTVFLQKGINIIDVDADGAIALDYLRVRATDAEAVTVEAEDGALTNGETVDGQYAAGGSYVAGLKAPQIFSNLTDGFTVEGMNGDFMSYESNAAAKLIYADYDGEKLTAAKTVGLPAGENAVKLETGHGKIFVWQDTAGISPLVNISPDAEGGSLELNVNVPEDGEYKMVIRHSNGELLGAHDYNAQVVDRYSSYSVNGADAERLYFKNTFSDENWRTVAVPVTLAAGDNTVRFFNDNWRIVRCGVLKSDTKDHIPENIDYRTLTNYTPNFDSFEFYPAVAGAAQAEEKYKVSVMATEGGTVSIDKTSAAPGEAVTLTLKHDWQDGTFAVSANGKNVSSQIKDGVLSLEINENTEIRVEFVLPENLDEYISNNSFGTGDLTDWTAENVTVEGTEGAYKAVLSDGGSLSQTMTDIESGYYTLEFEAEGEGKVSFGGKETAISPKTVLTAYGEGELELTVTGDGLTADNFRITDFLPADTELLYFVDCGDRDVNTLSEGDKLGVNNSVTEQFYAADPVTGKKWGIDDEYVKNDTYPTLLTGADTWPYEQGGADDGCVKAASYRYAKDQTDHVGPGVTYKFELEDGVYSFQAGFYTPWSTSSDNRKSSLRINDKVIASGIVPSMDVNKPVTLTGVANVTGGTATLNLNLDSDGKGGPMISYIKISAVPFKLVDTTDKAKTDGGTWEDRNHAPNAFDSDVNTMFDGNSGGWAQIDLGEGTSIAAIGFIPRPDYPGRMVNTAFYGSNDGSQWTELYRITEQPPVYQETRAVFEEAQSWRYIKYENKNDYCNVNEIYLYSPID